MDRGSLARFASWTAEEVARKVYGVEIAKALDPLDPEDFITISVRLARALRGATKGAEAEALKAAIERLDVDWPSLSTDRIDRIVAAARAEIAGTAAVLGSVDNVLEGSVAATMARTRVSARKRYDLQVVREPTTADRETADLLRRSQMVYLKDEFGKRADVFDQRAKSIVASGLERGLGRDDISEELSEKLSAYQINRSRNYYNIIATDFSNKSRTAAQVGVFEEGGILRYRYEAVMDSVTSTVCRLLHGKIFTVKSARKNLDEAMSLDDPEEIRNASPFVRNGLNANGREVLFYERGGRRTVVADVLSSGVGRPDDAGAFNQRVSDERMADAGIAWPPRHPSCRSTIVPA